MEESRVKLGSRFTPSDHRGARWTNDLLSRTAARGVNRKKNQLWTGKHISYLWTSVRFKRLQTGAHCSGLINEMFPSFTAFSYLFYIVYMKFNLHHHKCTQSTVSEDEGWSKEQQKILFTSWNLLIKMICWHFVYKPETKTTAKTTRFNTYDDSEVKFKVKVDQVISQKPSSGNKLVNLRLSTSRHKVKHFSAALWWRHNTNSVSCLSN